MMMVDYYCYDTPAALKSQLEDYMGSPANFETLYALLYSVYAFPNILLPFFGGYFICRLGARVCLLVFILLEVCGQLTFAFGIAQKSWAVILLGRTIFGLGGSK